MSSTGFISDVIKARDPGQVSVSFEYFAPRTEAGQEKLKKTLELMKGANPLFGDFTWGAGGSTSDLTLQFSILMNQLGFNTNMHLTCTNMPKEKIDNALEECKKNGIRNILALRGDPPAGQKEWQAIDSGFSCALDLVKYIREHHGDYFHLTVAGYPEGHPDAIGDAQIISAENYKKELEYLKKKVDAGSQMIITQMFFDTDRFIQFAKDCQEFGINVPVIPGIMPIMTYDGFKRMTSLCKTYVPKEILEKLEELKGDADKVKEYGVDLCVETCQKLINNGFTHLHFYCLNSEVTTFAILRKLGVPVPN